MISYPFVEAAVVPFEYLQPTKINFPCKVYLILPPQKRAVFGGGRISVGTLFEPCPSMSTSCRRTCFLKIFCKEF